MADIEVTLDDDKEIKKPAEGAEEVIVEPKEDDKKPEKAEIPVETAIAELKKRLQDEENARKEAERRAKKAEEIAAAARNEAEDSNKHLIVGAIETLKRDMGILKTQYKSALASGNYEEAASINEKMTQTTNRLGRLEEGKAEMERRPKVETPATPSGGDMVEEFASKLSAKSADWIRRHPECVTDVSMNQQMIGAHTMALGKRIPVDSPEYFEFIESQLGMSGGTREVSSAGSEAPQQSTGGRQAAPPAAAPVSRAASTNGTNRPNVVRLSEAERDIADSLGMSYQEYAKNKLALQKAGKIN